MLKYKIPQIVTLTRLTLGLTEPCKPTQFGHKKRELHKSNSLISW